MTLDEIAIKYNTDKSSHFHNYCEKYNMYFSPKRNDELKILELGIQNGYSLKTWKEWEPDAFIVEKKAAGAPLIQELRAMGIPVEEFTPSRGRTAGSTDKVARLNAVSDLFASGKIWAPDTRWAKEVVEEVASFPVGEHDDYVDTVSQALLRFRQGGFITLPTDMQDELQMFRRKNYAYY